MKKKYIVLSVISMKNSKTLKYYTSSIQKVFSFICDKCSSNDYKLFKEEESIEILKVLGLIDNINE